MENSNCDKCLTELKFFDHRMENPDRAAEFRITGGYGMFIDMTQIDLTLCHQCALEFFRSIPKLNSDEYRGMHSVAYTDEDYPLCCEYSWASLRYGSTEKEDTAIEKGYESRNIPGIYYGSKEFFRKEK